LSTKLKLPTRIACDLEEPVLVTAPVARKLQQKRLVVTAVSDVPEVSEQKMAIARGIACLLERAFQLQKWAAKRLGDTHSAILCHQINTLRRSDPARDRRRYYFLVAFFAAQ